MKQNRILYEISSWLPVLFVCSLIFYVSSYQTATVSNVQQQEFYIKKLAHVMWSSSLAIFIYRALVRSGVDKKNASFQAIAFVFLFGSTDEIHQRFVAGRESRFRDVVIDTLGASVAILLLWKLRQILPQKLKSLVSKWDLL